MANEIDDILLARVAGMDYARVREFVRAGRARMRELRESRVAQAAMLREEIAEMQSDLADEEEAIAEMDADDEAEEPAADPEEDLAHAPLLPTAKIDNPAADLPGNFRAKQIAKKAAKRGGKK